MAGTSEGRELTDAHRKAQIVLSGQINLSVRELGTMIDLGDIDSSTPRFNAAVSRLVANGHSTSQELAATYLQEYTRAEIGEGHEINRVIPDWSRLHEDLRVKGPVKMKSQIAAGVPAEVARDNAIRAIASRVAVTVMNGGRYLLESSVKYYGKSGRWRRVTDGKPCAFCAMIAGRGPVYSEQTAHFHVHDYCGCNIEPVYGEWEPNELERQWQASYILAAEEATALKEPRVAPILGRTGPDGQWQGPPSAPERFRNEDTILWRMRRNAPHLFHDGVTPKQ